jgi:hypothetical protein
MIIVGAREGSSVFVCPLSTRRLKVVYYNLNISAGFTLIFPGFQLTDFDKKPSLKRYSAFHSYFVVSRLHKRLRILLVVWLLRYKYFLAIDMRPSKYAYGLAIIRQSIPPMWAWFAPKSWRGQKYKN